MKERKERNRLLWRFCGFNKRLKKYEWYCNVVGYPNYFYKSRFRDHMVDTYFPHNKREKYLSYMKKLSEKSLTISDIMTMNEVIYGHNIRSWKLRLTLLSIFDSKKDMKQFAKITIRMIRIYFTTTGKIQITDEDYDNFLQECVFRDK